MDDTKQPGGPTAMALEPIPTPEEITFEIIREQIGPSVDKALDRAAKLAAAIVDEPTKNIALDAVERIKEDMLAPLEKWREEFYMETHYRPGEIRREVFDSRIKPAKAAIKTILGQVSDYNIKKEREARLAREKAEAEARRAREELERKQKELEEAQRKEREAKAAEEKRIEDARIAEEKRIQAEKELKERKEREAREAAAAETARKLKEEEEARLRHAQEAQAQGNGPAKVDTILESATAISPVLAKPEQTKDLETQRLEQEQATRLAEEKLLKEQAASAAAEKARKEAEAETERKRAEVQRATEAATAAAAAQASTSIAKKEESRTVSVTRWVWDLDSDGTEEGDKKAVIELLKGIVEGYVPIEFCGYDPKHPEKFRPTVIGERVSEDKDLFKCPGIRAYPQQDERLKARRVVGGRR